MVLHHIRRTETTLLLAGEARMNWKVKVYLSKDKKDWLYLVDEKTLEPKVFDDWTDAQVEAHLWSYSDIEEVRRG
jgi:hypothetical protein